MNQYQNLAKEVLQQMSRVILGKEDLLNEVLAAVLAGGHILLEDRPGVGKTTLAVALSKIIGLQWRRVQFTPDVLPSDLTGFSIYRQDIQQFVYQPGAVFCNLLLADEINRTSPKTQSALLEVMEEHQVTVEGVTRKVPDPFLVIATQNPVGAAGTQMLPTAQMDRFMVCLTMGYPDFKSEVTMAMQVNERGRSDFARQVIDLPQLIEMKQQVENVFVHQAIYEYVVKLMEATRSNPYLESGASPRGTLALVKMARASAWLNGNEYVSPDDVTHQFLNVAIHRVGINGKARMEGLSKTDVLSNILKATKRPSLQENYGNA